MSSPRARESNLWNWLKDHGTSAILHRVEDCLSRGTPDVFGVLPDGRALALELKSVPRPPRAAVWCELRSEQASFLRRWARSGGSAWVLVQVGVAAAAKRYLVHAEHCAELLKPISEDRLVALSVHPTTPYETVVLM